jgi:hypothetical protein
MPNPPNNNDLQREKVRFLNQSLSLQNIIKQGSIANSSRDNVLPGVTLTLPVSLTPSPTITPTINITPIVTHTPTMTPTLTPTPSVTPPSQGLLVNTTNQFISFGASSNIYNSYFYKINDPYIDYPFIDTFVNIGYLDLNNNSIIFYDNINFTGWTIFNLNLYTAVCSASLPLNYLIPFSGWVGLLNDENLNFNNFSVINVPGATPTPTLTMTPSITPTVTLTPSITPSNTPTISITPSITPTFTLLPPALVVTAVSGISANFFNYLNLSGTYLREGSVYPGYFFKRSNIQKAYCDLYWYEKNDLFTNSPPGYLFLAQYEDNDSDAFNTYYWGIAFSEYPSSSSYPPAPLGIDLPPSGRYFPLSTNDESYVIDYLLKDPTICLDLTYDFTPLTPTPTPSITPTITLTPSITPTLTPTISITPSNTPTISITPSITPTITVTISLTPTQAPTTTIYVSGNASFFANFTNIPGTSAIVMFTDGSTFNGKPFYQYVGQTYRDIIQMYWAHSNQWVFAYQGSFFLTNNTESYYPPFKETYSDANGWTLFPLNSTFFGANSQTISSLRITNYLLFPTPTPTPSLTPGYYVETYFKSFSIPLLFTNNSSSLSIDQFGSNNPSFTAFRFRNYDLITDSLSSDLHLALRVYSNNSSTQVTGTFNNNIVTGISGGVILFTPDDNTPNEIIYQCTNNPSISGTIFIRYPNLVLSTPTPTISITPTVTDTPTATPTVTPTLSPTPTPTNTLTPTFSPTPSTTLPPGLIDATTTQFISVINVDTLGITLTALRLGLYEGGLAPTRGYVYYNVDDCFIDYFEQGLPFENYNTPVSGWYIYQERPYWSGRFYLRCYQPALSSGTNFVPATTGWIYLTGAGQQGDQSLYNKLKIVKGSFTSNSLRSNRLKIFKKNS